MPRDPAKLSKAALAAELREKHGVETVEVVVAPPTGYDDEGFEMPEGVEVRYVPDPDFEPDPDAEEPESQEMVPQFFERVSVEDAPKDALLDQFGNVLDTTTEREREKATRAAVKRENEQAEMAAAALAEGSGPESA